MPFRISSPVREFRSLIRHQINIYCQKGFSFFTGSKFTIENYLEKYDFSSRVFSLCDQGLTTMCHLELLPLVEKVDLSRNGLIDVKNFSCMRCVKELILDSNQISDISELSFLPNLEVLSLKNNCILSYCLVKPYCHFPMFFGQCMQIRLIGSALFAILSVFFKHFSALRVLGIYRMPNYQC